MNNKICIVSLAFGWRYVEQMEVLKRSIPEGVAFVNWINQMPPGARPFEESLYGFKPHAVKTAQDMGYEKIIWLDPACIVNGTEEELRAAYFSEGCKSVIAVKDDNLLHKTISIIALNYYGSVEADWHLVGGSFYAFDLSRTTARAILDDWLKAEKAGMFGSQIEASSEQINGHRHDESCMAASMYIAGVTPVSHETARYCNGESSLILKKHFK